MISTETKLKIVELRSQGKSIATIAKETNLAKQTLVDTCKEMKEEIAALYAIQLDALYEAERIGVEQRIKNYSSLLGKLKEELDARTLADVPTEKLVDMYIKTASALEGTIVEPIFKSSKEQQEEREERDILQSLT